MKLGKIIIQISVFFTIFFISTSDKKAYTSKPFRHNMTSLDMDVTDDKKSYIDKETNFILSTCQSDFDLQSQLGITNNTGAPLCSKADSYEGACWVQALGLIDGRHKLRICHQQPSSTAVCQDLANGEYKNSFSVQLKEFGETDIGYQGGYGLASDDSDCPDITANINAIGYNYIYEATDPQYRDYEDFVLKYCQPLSENFNPSLCDFPSTCACDGTDCKKNNFIPPKKSDTWKNSSQKAKNCYLCLQKYRAVQFYCKKVYKCLHKYKNKSHIYVLAKNEETRPFIKKMFGPGIYLCGYYNNTLCGCAKEKLPAGPRHFARIAYKQDVDKCATTEDIKKNPQCNLYESNVRVRQFRNDNIFNSNAECEKDKNLPAEYGWKHRGTFFSPALNVVFGENERNIQFDSRLLIDDEEGFKADYYYNDPKGVDYNNGLDTAGLPTTQKIIYGNFYPIIYALGAKYKVLNEKDECVYRTTGEVAFIMLRLEYNISTNDSSLVAYRVRFTNTVPTNFDSSGKLLKPDGSFAKFKANSDSDIFEQVKNAKNNSNKEYLDQGEFKYSDDPDQQFIHKTLTENGNFLIFENIGKVQRPPLKYGYDEGSEFIVSPISLEQIKASVATDDEKNITRLKIAIKPSNLSVFHNSDEFKYDSKLPMASKNVTISNISKDVYDLNDNTITSKTTTSIQDFAFLYFKRFSVSYTNPCIFIKNFLNEEKNKYFTTDIPKNISDCLLTDDKNEKIACYTSFTLYNECQGYISCLKTSKSITECQNEGRLPEVKIEGTDDDLLEYQKNLDFRQKVDICISEGFDFADKISKYSNTRLFGDFGYPPYDYTIRMKKDAKSKFANTPSKPLTIKKESTINDSDNYQFDKKNIIKMDINYFSDKQENRTKNMLSILKNSYMKHDTTNMLSETTAFNYYVSECFSNESICENKLEVKHKEIQETFSNLCVESMEFNGGTWDLKPRDLGVDYNVYVPLRCQYIDFDVKSAGGAGLTSTGNAPRTGKTNCVVQWQLIINSGLGYCWTMKIFKKKIKICIELPCVFVSGSYNRMPKFDATGSQGASVAGILDVNKLPIFDGYLSVTTGARPKAIKSLTIPGDKDDGPEDCFTGVTPFHVVGKNTSTWYAEGGTHSYWKLGTSFTASSGHKYKDNRKGVSEVKFDTHGGEVENIDYSAIYKAKINENNTQIATYKGKIETLTNSVYNYRMLEFYFVILQLMSEQVRKADVILYETTKLAIEKIKEIYQQKKDDAKTTYENKQTIYNNDKTALDNAIQQKKEKEAKDPPEDTTEEDNIISTINARIEQEKQEMLTAKAYYDEIVNIIKNDAYPEEEIKTQNVQSDEITELLSSINDDIYNSSCVFLYDASQNEQDIQTFFNSFQGHTTKNKCDYQEPRNYNLEKTTVNNLKEALDYDNLEQQYKDLFDSYEREIERANSQKKNKITTILKPITISYDNININNVKTILDETITQYNAMLTNAINLSFQNDKFNQLKSLFDESSNHRTNLHQANNNFVKNFNREHQDNYYNLYKTLCNGFSKTFKKDNCEYSDYDKPHNKIDSEDKQLNTLTNTLQESVVVNADAAGFNADAVGFEKRFFHADIKQQDEDITDAFDNISLLLSQNNSYSNMIASASQDNNNNDNNQNTEQDNNNGKNKNTEQYLFRAERGYSPIDCRVTRQSCGGSTCPCFNNNKRDSGIIKNRCILDETQVLAHHRSLAENGFYGNAMSTRLNIHQQALGHCLSKYMVDNKCSIQDGQPSRMATDSDHRNELGHYTPKNEYSNDGPGSDDTRHSVHGYINKYNKSIGGGGSYFHNGYYDGEENIDSNREGTGSGGSGDIKMSAYDVKIKQFEYNGNWYPDLNDDGTKKIGGTKNDARCTVRCPPIYVKYDNFSFYFPEVKDTRDISVICEYTGEPETDMEAEVGKTYAPKKCYIATQNLAGIGEVKGKIIAELVGSCPIAKCSNGIYNTAVGNGEVTPDQLQYDRKSTLCKPKDKYGTDATKSSWYYNMMFDKNIYSSMMYTGSKSVSLSSDIYQNGKTKSFIIASCAQTPFDKYYNDEYSLLNTLELKCSENGFWRSTTSIKPPTLYTEDELKNEKDNETTYPDYLRNNEYNSNNRYMNYTEYLIKDSRYVLNKTIGYEFDIDSKTPTESITTGNKQLDSNGAQLGRTLFKDKIYCPIINADLYDFDEDYSGNANWDYTQEGKTISGTCRSGSNNIYIQNENGAPHRVCKTNGMWGPVINPCYKGCELVIDENPPYTKWQITQEDISRIDTTTGTVRIYGNCASNYLNSQDYSGNSTTGQDYRICNVKTGTWGKVNTGNCNDSIIDELEDNYKDQYIATPLARVFNYTADNEYNDLIKGLEKKKYRLENISQYIQGLYIGFNPSRYDSEDFNEQYYKAENQYISVDLQDINLDTSDDIKPYIYDQKKHLLLDYDGNNNYFVIKVKNTLYPKAFSVYMLAQGNTERNEFLNIQNWVQNIKETNMNFTGQWSWKANLSFAKSKGVYNSTPDTTQQIYKNSSLLVFIKKTGNFEKDIRHIALFSPYLANLYAINNDKQYSDYLTDNKNIKFRYLFDISGAELVNYEPYPIIVYDSAISAGKRLYRFEWDDERNKDWTTETGHTHKIGERKCYGKYYGEIEHNTLKHIMYTDEPTNEIQTFASLFCYDGRIFGYHAFQTKFAQEYALTDKYTKDIFLAPDKNGYTYALDTYNKQKSYFNQTSTTSNNYFSDEHDPNFATAKNAYVAGFMSQYWAKFIIPDDKTQEIFMQNYNSITDTHYKNTRNPQIASILEQYAKDNKSKYYRIVERQAEWISGNVVSTDALYDIYKIDFLK